eukprot:3284301-Rhodomonas_salina.1
MAEGGGPCHRLSGILVVVPVTEGPFRVAPSESQVVGAGVYLPPGHPVLVLLPGTLCTPCSRTAVLSTIPLPSTRDAFSIVTET